MQPFKQPALWKRYTRNHANRQQHHKTSTRSRRIIRTKTRRTAATPTSTQNARHYQRALKLFATNKGNLAAKKHHQTNRQNQIQQLQQTTATTTNVVIAKSKDICRKTVILASKLMHQWWTNRAAHFNQTSGKLEGSHNSHWGRWGIHSSNNNNSNTARSTSFLPLPLTPLRTQGQLSRLRESCGPARPQWRL